jgi:tellurite resistance protein TerC
MLGLRALYFALAGMMEKFHYLKVGLSLVLASVGAKMLVAGVYKVPILLSLSIVGLLLAGSVAASLLWPLKKSELPTQHAPPESRDRAAESRP